VSGSGPRLFTEEGLIGGECQGCGRRHFPATEWCPWCGEPDQTEVRLSTEGTLWSWTTVLTVPPGYTGPVPFGFGIVELPPDGLRLVTRLTEPDPGHLHAGQPMAFTIVLLDDDQSTWAFEPA
jgi:uncharacterized OB-fold protein